MKHTVETILAARERVPSVLNGLGAPSQAFHGWLFGLVLECVEPRERMTLKALAMWGEHSTEDLILAIAETITPRQMGATLSRLRRLKLVQTIRSKGIAYHDLGGWARLGGPVWKDSVL